MEIDTTISPQQIIECQDCIRRTLGLKYCIIYTEAGIFPFENGLPKRFLTPVSSNNSKNLHYYELTATFPERDHIYKNEFLACLPNATNATTIEGHFEIGKNGLYHYHFLIATTKYLRGLSKLQSGRVSAAKNPEIKRIFKWRFTLSSVRNIDAYKNYIKKEPKEIENWEDYYYQE